MKELKNLNSLNNKKLLVILPINRINDVFLNECFYSLAQQTTPIDLLVLTNKLTDEQVSVLKGIIDNPSFSITETKEDGVLGTKTIVADKKINYVIENTDKYTYPSVFNEAFNYADKNGYETFSVIEGEDVVDINWYNNANKYSVTKSNYHGFLPLTREISNGNFIGFFNEACWSEGLAEVAGVSDIQMLMRFNCINVSGGVFKTAAIKEYSEKNEDGYLRPMKESMKINYIYEFFLRMIYDDLKFFTVPRIGYEHRVDVSGASDVIDPFSSKVPRDITARPAEKGGITNVELKWWDELARKEYFYEEDRKISAPVVA